MFMDFLNMVFILFLFGFIVFYFIVGDRIATAERFIRAIMPFSFFGLVFLTKLKIKRREARQIKQGVEWDKVIIYFTDTDVRRDRAVIISLPIIIILAAVFNRQVMFIDFIQAGVVFVIMFAWHWFKIRKQSNSSTSGGFTKMDIIKDELLIFSLPVIIFLIPTIWLRIDLVDAAQATLPFAVMFFWRKILLRNSV